MFITFTPHDYLNELAMVKHIQNLYLNIELHIEYLKLLFKNTENLTVRIQCLKCLYYYFTLK